VHDDFVCSLVLSRIYANVLTLIFVKIFICWASCVYFTRRFFILFYLCSFEGSFWALFYISIIICISWQVTECRSKRTSRKKEWIPENNKKKDWREQFVRSLYFRYLNGRIKPTSNCKYWHFWIIIKVNK